MLDSPRWKKSEITNLFISVIEPYIVLASAQYLAEIVLPPILIEVNWLSDVGQEAPWTGRKYISDH